MKSTKYLILLFALCLFSCNEEYDEFGGTPVLNIDETNGNSEAFIENFGNSISRNFLGNVVDTDNNPIADVTITIGSSIASTDANGVFIINNASVKERFAYIKADKAGYIHGSRAVVPSAGTNKVTIMLLPETVVGTTSSGASETISLTNGASVALEGNYIKEDGTEYTGNVNVIMHHLDPVDDAMEDQMPGMLFAANIDNEERMLQSLGMLAIELRGDGGEDLNLAEESTAEINIPVDPSLVANAPATIPLWYFDEFYGYWKEEGQAILVGNSYVGTVSHFSYWNYDAQFPAVQLCITVVDADGNPLANQYTTLTHFNPDYLYPTSGGYTDDQGQVCGLVPQDETLEFNLINYDACGGASIHTESIGPFANDSSIEITATLDDPDLTTETVTGQFNDCDGNPVTEGYVVLHYNGQTFYDTVTDGNLEINLVRCSDELNFTIEALDFNSTQETGELNYTFTTPSTDLGTIAACNAVQEFITYQVDDHPVISYIVNLGTFYEGSGSSLIANTESELGYFSLDIFNCTGPGTQYVTPGDNVGFFFNDENGDGTSPNGAFGDLTFNVATIAGEDGAQFTDISFFGTYEDIDGTTKNISGSLHID